MVLSENEIREVTKNLIRCNIDLNQGINYCLDNKYDECRKNFLEVIKNLENIIDRIQD